MKANELVTLAYYISGVVSRDFETVSGSQLADGITMLNDLLTESSAKGNNIPYYTHQNFDCVKGQEEYFINDLIEVSALTYLNGNIRYSLDSKGRNEYFGSARAENVESLPSVYTVERSLGGSKIYIYMLPQDVFTFEITGKFFLSEVTTYTDLSTITDKYYQLYLKYGVAEMICQFNDVPFGMEKKQRLDLLESQIFQVDPPDMRFRKISAYSDSGINYAAANLYRGFLP